MIRNYIASAALLLVLASGAMLPAHAHAAIGLTIQPVKISETLKPGDTVSGVIRLTNDSDSAVSVSASTEDFVPVDGADSISFVGRADGVTSVKDWITLGEASSTFAFAQGESREIPYTITAPANAEPGGHFGVVFFKATKVDGGALNIGTQVGMLVLVAIPGNHLQKGEILDFSAPHFIQSGPVDFTIKFHNTGTVHFEPKGSITIKNMFGSVVTTVPIEGQLVLPTSIKELKYSWNVKGLLLGKYSATANILDGDGDQIASREVSFWAVPVWYILGFIVVFLLLLGIFRFLKSRVHISIGAK